MQPHPPLLHSPLSSVHSPAPPSVVIKPAEAVPGSPVAVTQHMDGKLLDMAEVGFSVERKIFVPKKKYHEVSHKLDNTLQVLRRMLKQSEPSVTAVSQFLDKFEKLQGENICPSQQTSECTLEVETNLCENSSFTIIKY